MNPKSVYERLVTVGSDWADKEHAANLLEAAVKSVKAKIALQHKDAGCGVAEAEMRAEADYEYRKLREDAIDARMEAIKAKVVYDAAKLSFEAWRTEQANERAASSYQT
jgi:hypothetical protein